MFKILFVIISLVMVAAGTSVTAAGTSVAAAGTLGTKCPDKFDRVGKHCLHIYRGVVARPWATHRQSCQDLAPAGWSTDFVILKDEAKLSIINKYIYDKGGLTKITFWVGARQVTGKNYPWMWLDDTPVDSSSNMWSYNQPYTNTLENVAMLVPASSNPFRLYISGTTGCSSVPSFVCEAVAE